VTVVVLTLIVLTVAVFLPVGRHSFIAFDDLQYVFENPIMRDGLSARGLGWAFRSAGYASNWHPLTWLSHMADVEMFGFDPGPHHLVNLLLHTANATALLLLWRTLTGNLAGGFVAAVLFAVHPLHVESVAWIAARKDVLSGLFFFLTIAAYLRARRTSSGLLLTVAMYALGLLAKPMLVTLPLVLLLLDYWPLGRWRFWKAPSPGQEHPGPHGERFSALLLEKAPLFLLAALSAAMTLYAQNKGGGLASASEYPLVPRVLNALVSLAAYVGKTVWPADLAFFYPHPRAAPPAYQIVVAGGSFLLATAVSCIVARTRPHLLTGWGWFLVMLLPVSGFVQVGDQAMADRYSYLPLIGLFLAAVTEISILSRRLPYGRLLAGIAAAVLVPMLAGASWRQVAYWKDSETLYRRAAEVTERNWLAEMGLGALATQQGRSAEAMRRYAQALLWRPDYYLAHNNLGVELAKIAAYQEAEKHFRESLRLRPGFLGAWLNLGQTLLQERRAAEAVDVYLRAVLLDQSNPDAVGGLGTALLMNGNPRGALPRLEAALRLQPDRAAFRHNRDLAAQTLAQQEATGRQR